MLFNKKNMCEPSKTMLFGMEAFKKKERISKACPDAQLSTSD